MLSDSVAKYFHTNTIAIFKSKQGMTVMRGSSSRLSFDSEVSECQMPSLKNLKTP